MMVIFVGLVIAGLFFYFTQNKPTEQTLVATALYTCDAGKAITARYFRGEGHTASSVNQPPIPNGRIEVSLSDGRKLTLPQTISADGGRYANTDESTIFWNKGRNLMVTEKDTETYTGCIETSKDPGTLPQVYASSTKGFSVRYPIGFEVNSEYHYQALGQGKDISGVKFTIAKAMTAGTNLSADSYISVEQIPGLTECSATPFLYQGVKVSTTTDGNTEYSVGTLSGAAAGNRYEETIYAIPGTNPCVAIRYFVHYGAIENYPSGAVQAFDKGLLIKQFDLVRRTLISNN